MYIKAGLSEHYDKGSEVYMRYGRYSNRQLLTVYGFALKDNRYNFANLKIRLEDMATHENLKDYIVENGFDDLLSFKLYKSTFPGDLLSTIRAFN